MVAGRKLLLADDSVTIQKVVELTFADEGIEVITFGNGAQAVEQLEQLNPDVVLADVFMPGMNGYQVCEHIKRDERFRHIPVMLLVGSFEPFDEAEARRVGADDFLTKPFQSIRQLVSKVGALLGGGAAQDEAPTRDLRPPAETKHAAAASGSSPINREELERSTADTAPLPQHMASQWVEQNQSGARAAASSGHTAQEEEATQTMSVNNFGNPMETVTDERQQPGALRPAQEPGGGATDAHLENGRRDYSYDRMQRTISPFGTAAAQESGNRVAARSTAAAGFSDETLLELDDEIPYRGAAEADEFILDLQDEAFTMDTASLEEYEEEMKVAAPEAQEFVEAQLEVEEQRADFAPVEEESPVETPSTQEEPPPPPAPTAIVSEALAEHGSEDEATAVETSSAAAAVQPTGQITLAQLSPEVIDAIARRAVELLSEKVVEEVAWEVVPQLAELHIKHRLEQERTKAQ